MTRGDAIPVRGRRNGLQGAATAGLLLLALARAAGAQPLPAPTGGQEATTAILPTEIRVGDIFRAAVRIDLPPGTRAVVPDTLVGSESLEPAGRVELRSEELPGGGTRLTAVYPMTVWRTGENVLDPVRIRILGDGIERFVTAPFPAFAVASVLPVDSAGIEPMPAKDVLGGTRVVWPWLLLGAALLLAALTLYLRRRGRGAAPAARAFAFDPRGVALAALADARGVELARQGDVRRLYVELADALRFYVATLSALLGRDRTTHELEEIAPASPLGTTDAQELLSMLERADAVKFARADATSDVALTDWRAARAWVERVGLAEPVVAGPDAATEEAVP